MNEATRILALIDAETRLHPAAEYRDYYKMFFQGTFGPGHIIPSADIAADYLRAELPLSDTSLEVRDIGYRGDFLRVGTGWVANGSLTVEQCALMLVESCVEPPLSPEEWVAEWKMIDGILTTRIAYRDGDRRALLNALEEGRFLLSHSEEYRREYRPHYRVLRQSVLNRHGCHEILRGLA